MLLKKTPPNQRLLQAIKEQDVDEIVEITRSLCKDTKIYNKLVDIPKHFFITEDLLEKTAVRRLIMAGKLNFIYTTPFPPIQCETDFRLINEDVDASDMAFIFEPVSTNELVFEKIDRLLEYHNILANIDYFERSLSVVRTTHTEAAVFEEAQRYVTGSLFLNSDFYRLYLKNVCAYQLDYQVFDERFEKFAQFLVANSQRRYNEDYFSRCGELRREILEIAQEEDKLRYLRAINTGQSEIMRIGIQLFIEANQTNFSIFSEEFLEAVQRFKAVKIEISSSYLLNGILLLGEIFGLHEVINQNSFSYTSTETILLDAKMVVFKNAEHEYGKPQFALFAKVPAPQELLNAYRDHDIEKIHAEVKRQVTASGFSNFQKFAEIPKYMNIPESITLDAAVYGMIAQGKVGLIFQNELPPLPCETDFRLINEVNTKEMKFYFEKCENFGSFQAKIERIYEMHSLSLVKYQFGGSLSEFTEVERSCQHMEERDLIFGSKFLDFESYTLFLRSISGYNDDLHWYDPNYEVFAEFLRDSSRKSYNQDYFSCCGKYFDRILYYFVSDSDKMHILNTLNCEKAELMSFGALLYVRANPDYSKCSPPFVENIEEFSAIEPQEFKPIERLIFIIDICNLFFKEELPNLAYEYREIERLKLIECSANENCLLTEFRNSETAEGSYAIFKEMVETYIGKTEEILIVLLGSGNKELNKFGVQFYAYRELHEIDLLLVDELCKNDVLQQFLKEIIANRKKSIFTDETQAQTLETIYESKAQLFMPLLRQIEHQIDFMPDTMEECETMEQFQRFVRDIFTGLQAYDFYPIMTILYQNVQELDEKYVLPLYGFNDVFERREQMALDVAEMRKILSLAGANPDCESINFGNELIFQIFITTICQFKDLLLFLLLNLAGYYTSNIALIQVLERRKCFDNKKYLQAIILLETIELEEQSYERLDTHLPAVHELYQFISNVQQQGEMMFRLQLFHMAEIIQEADKEIIKLTYLYFLLFTESYIILFSSGIEEMRLLAAEFGFSSESDNFDEFTLEMVASMADTGVLVGFLGSLVPESALYTPEELDRIHTSIRSAAMLILEESIKIDIPIQYARIESADKLIGAEEAAFSEAKAISNTVHKYAKLFSFEALEFPGELAEKMKYAYLEKNNVERPAFEEFKALVLLKDFTSQNCQQFCEHFCDAFQTTTQEIDEILNEEALALQKQYGIFLNSLQACYDNHAVLFLLQVLIEDPNIRCAFPIGSILFSAHWDAISAFVEASPQKISNWYLDYLEHLNIEHADDFATQTSKYALQIGDVTRLQIEFSRPLLNIIVLYHAVGFAEELIAVFMIQFCTSQKILDHLFMALFRQSGETPIYMQQVINQLTNIENLLAMPEPHDLRLQSSEPRIEFPNRLVLYSKEINNDPILRKFATSFPSNPAVLFETMQIVKSTFSAQSQAIEEMQKEMLLFNSQHFCIPFELFGILFAALLLQNPKVLKYIVDVWLMFQPNQELLAALRGGFVELPLEKAIQLKISIPESPLSVNKDDIYETFYAYRSIIDLYKKIVQNSMLFSRKLQILNIGVGQDPIATSLEYLLLEVAISDSAKHSRTFSFTDVGKKLRDDQELEFAEVFIILIQCLLNENLQKTLLSRLIEDQYLNMRQMLIYHSMNFVERLGKIELDDPQRTPNFWLHLLCQNIEALAHAEFTSVLSSRFESYGSAMDRRLELENVMNTYDCFKQEECTSDALCQLLAFGYYDYDEQIDFLIQVLTTNETVFKIITNVVKDEEIEKLAKDAVNEQEFVDDIVHRGYLVDYLRQINDKADLFEQALDVGHLFCSQEEVLQLINSSLCQNYANESFQSSSVFTQGNLDERVIHDLDLIDQNDNIQEIRLQDEESSEIAEEKIPEELNLSEIMSNTTAVMSVRPDVIHTEMLEKLTEFSDSDDAVGAKQLFLTSECLHKIEDDLAVEVQHICNYDLEDAEILQNCYVGDSSQLAVVYQAPIYRVQYNDSYYKTLPEEDAAIQLLELKQSDTTKKLRLMIKPVLSKSMPLLLGLSSKEISYPESEVATLDFEGGRSEDVFEYSESDQFPSGYEYLADPFTHQKFSVGCNDVHQYQCGFYQSNITSIVLESKMSRKTARTELQQMLQMKRLLLSYADIIFGCEALLSKLTDLSSYSELINPKWSIFELLNREKNEEAVFNRIEREYHVYTSSFKSAKLSRLCKLEAFRMVHTIEFFERSTIVRLANAIRTVFAHTGGCAFCQKILTKCTACGRILTERFDILTVFDSKAPGCKRCLRLSCKQCQCVNCE